MIVRRIEVEGAARGAAGWFEVRQANVSYDHPFHAPQEHALNIDFVNEAQGPGARVAVELTEGSARELVRTIEAVLAEAERGGYTEDRGTVEDLSPAYNEGTGNRERGTTRK